MIFDLIKNEFNHGNKVEVWFNGVTALNSSFVNSTLIELLEDYTFDYIRSNLKFTNTTKQINSMIKERFAFEVKRKKTWFITKEKS